MSTDGERRSGYPGRLPARDTDVILHLICRPDQPTSFMAVPRPCMDWRMDWEAIQVEGALHLFGYPRYAKA